MGRGTPTAEYWWRCNTSDLEAMFLGRLGPGFGSFFFSIGGFALADDDDKVVADVPKGQTQKGPKDLVVEHVNHNLEQEQVKTEPDVVGVVANSQVNSRRGKKGIHL